MKKSNGTFRKIVALTAALGLFPLFCACEGDEVHEHVYSDVWSYDETYHWQEPLCGDTDEPRGKSLHNYIQGVCSLCGYNPNPKEPSSDDPQTPWTPPEPSDPDNPDENPDEGEIDEPWIEPEEPGDVAGSMKLGATERSGGFDYTELIDESGRLAGYSIAAGEHLGDSSISIPESYKGKPVLRISRLGFKNASMKSITLPDGILEIGELAFDSCTNLTSFTMPNSVVSMEDMAFYNCTALHDIKLSNSLQGVYYRAFYNCAFESLVLPDSLTEIGGMAFQGCKSMRVLTFGKNIKSIGKQAFKDCKAFNVLKVPDIKSYCNIAMDYSSDSMPTFHIKHIVDLSKSNEDYVKNLNLEGVEDIPDKAFGGILDIVSVKIGDDVKSLGTECFAGCIALESVTFGKNVEKIGGLAFYNCVKLENLVLPDALSEISYRLFWNCSELKSVTIGSKLKKIGREVFLSCKALTDVYYKGSSKDWEAIEKDYDWKNAMPSGVNFHYGA